MMKSGFAKNGKENIIIISFPEKTVMLRTWTLCQVCRLRLEEEFDFLRLLFYMGKQ